MSTMQIWSPSDSVLLWWISTLLQVTLISGLGLLTANCLRRNAANRYSVLCAALFLCLLSPLSVIVSFHAGLPLFSLPRNNQQSAGNNEIGGIEIGGIYQVTKLGTRGHADVEPGETEDDRRRETQQAAVPTAVRDSSTPNAKTGQLKLARAASGLFNLRDDSAHISARSVHRLRQIASAMFIVWAVGTVPCLVSVIRGYGRVAAILRGAATIEDECAQTALAEACSRIGMARVPRLLSSSRVASPIVAGISRPSVILPEGIATQLGARRLRDVLLHEVSHLARYDQLTAPLQHLVAIIFWPHPFVRLMNRRLSRSREELCDNHVLVISDGPSYSRTLLQVAEFTQQTGSLCGMGLLTASWKLEDRVSGILNDGRNLVTHQNALGRLLVLVVSLFLGTLTLVSAVTSSEAADEVQSTTSADDDGDTGSSPAWENEVEPTASLSRDLRELQQIAVPEDRVSQELEARAGALLQSYDSSPQRGQICVEVAKQYHSSGVHSRTIPWTQTALLHPLALVDRLRMYQYWFDARQSNRWAASRPTWQDHLPAVLGYLEATARYSTQENRQITASREQLLSSVAKSILPQHPGIIRDSFRILEGSQVFLDPQSKPTAPPDWVPKHAASVASFRVDWPRVMEIGPSVIDPIAGGTGFFNDLLASLRDDPNGPQLDIRANLVPHLGERMTIVTDYREALAAQGPRLLVGVRLERSQPVANILQKMCDADPSARLIEVNGIQIWKTIPEEDNAELSRFLCVAKDHLLIATELGILTDVCEE